MQFIPNRPARVLQIVFLVFAFSRGVFGCASAGQGEEVPARLAARSQAGHGDATSSPGTIANEKVRDPIIRLERFRPWYEIIISRDGSVMYMGKDFVNAKGARESKISGPQLQILIAAAEKIRFSDLSTDYTSSHVADAALVELSYWSHGIKKTVRFQPYAGKAPVVVGLREFADLVDSAVETKKWICPLPRFNEVYCAPSA